MNLQYLAILALLIIIVYYVFVRKTKVSSSVIGYWDLTDEICEFNKLQKKCLNKFNKLKTF